MLLQNLSKLILVEQMISKIKFIAIVFFIFTLCGCHKKTPNIHIQELINKGTYSYQNSTYPKDAKEVDEPMELKVTGHVPEWLKGKLFRNGPGKFSVGDKRLTHWFDGFALVSSFEFKKNKIYYQAAFLKSDQLLESIELNDLKLSGFGQNLGESPAKHISRDGQKVKTANASINIERIGRHLIAFGETPLPIEFEPATLKTIGIFDYNDNLKKAKTWESAHMKRDPADGALYNFYIDYGKKSAYVIYKIEDKTTSRKLLARHEVSEPSYMHDFSITENYVILTAYPLVVNPIDLLNPKYSFIGAHRWEPDRRTTVYIFDKKTGELVSALDTQAMFAFHHINAFEGKDGLINLYLSASDNGDVVVKLGEAKTKYANVQLQKMVIDLNKSSIDIIRLSKKSYEMPSIKGTLVGRENHYFYAVWYNPPGNKKGFGLVKYDVKTNKTEHWLHEGLFPGEPLFVSNPAAKNEDDGVILSVVYDKSNKESFLVIIDAHSMKELARAEMPQSLPIGLHGRFIKSES